MNNSRDVDEKLTILNLAPLGFWYQLGIAPRELFALQGLGGVFTELNTTIVPQVLAQGASATFLSEWSQFLSFCRELNFVDDETFLLWNDP